MKTTLKAKLLQHLIAKKEEGGFTLIELLVVIIIIGILAAIALPSFLNQANRARQSEAVTYVGSVNRAQQAHRLENPEFASTIPELGLGIQEETDFYVYAIPADDVNEDEALVTATPRNSVLLGYAGLTYITTDPGGNATTTAILCKGTAGTVPDCTVPTVPADD
ncbi:MAG: prepilin-type N-terminal cleavage/methylation domain-containing protein [Leptolyngbya sp. DLM2.Bin27]|nr:MAG: prepilin-type N-terminal cleavage/methylation domain-containing protein [Leptolyngbya sp. DLM2.Bin27]